MTISVTFGTGVGITVGGTVSLAVIIGLCVAIWRCCCGDNNLWRGVAWCKGKSSKKGSGQDGSPVNTGTRRSSRKTGTCDCNCFSCCVSHEIHVEYVKPPSDLKPSTNDAARKVSSDVINQQPLPTETVNGSQPIVGPSTSNQTAVPSAPPAETQADNEITTLLPQRQPTNDSQPTVDPSVSNEFAPRSAPPEETRPDIEDTPLLPQQPTNGNQPTVDPSTSNQTAVPSAPLEETQPDNQTTPMLPQKQLVNDNRQINIPCTTNEIAQSAPPATQNDDTTATQHSVTTGYSSEISDQIDASGSQTNSYRPEQESTATVNPHPSASQTNTNQPQQQSEDTSTVNSQTASQTSSIQPLHHSTATVNPQADARQTNSYQPQQQNLVNPRASVSQTTSNQPQQESVERVSMPSSSTSPSGTCGCVTSLPTVKRSFSAKFMSELGKVLNPPSPVDADWHLILIELQQSQREVNQVALMTDPTAEALRRWQEAGRSMDELLEVYKKKRLDVYHIIESCMKNNGVYSVIPAEIVPQTPRHGDAVVTKDQLSDLASNLGFWDELAENMSMSKGDIYKCKQSNKYSEWAQVYCMLDKWKDREYENATVGLLVEICRKTKTVYKEMYAFLLD